MSSRTLEKGERRTYRSAQRELRARETRERILGAASTEFGRAGYAATRIGAVAQAAGVSVATVELVFRTKAQLLRAAISFCIRGDADPTPMLERPWALSAQRACSAEAFLGIVGRVLVEGQQRSAGVIVAAFEAAHQDGSISAVADQLREQRVETATWVIDGLIARGALSSAITRKRAIDTVWLLMDPHGFVALTRHRGWSAAQFETWFTDSVHALLIDEPGATAKPARPAHPRAKTSQRKRRTS